MNRNRRLAVLGLSLASCIWMCGCQAIQPPVPTCWDKMGITGAYTTIRDARLNRFGKNPLKEWKPPKLRIADPKNLESPNPAIKVAAEIKTAEDLAEQKIKALRYLGMIGCCCYDKDGAIRAAFLDALNDCTPCVRKAAIEALTMTANECNEEAQKFNAQRENCDPRRFGELPRGYRLQQHCQKCGGRGCRHCASACGECGEVACGCGGGPYACCSCLGKDICKRLEEMAYKQNDDGCWLEPIAEIRSAAAALLSYCRPEPEPVTPPVIEIEGGGDTEGSGGSAYNGSQNPQTGFVSVARPSPVPTISGQITSAVNQTLSIQFSSGYKLPVGARLLAQTQNGSQLELIVTSTNVGQVGAQIVTSNPPGAAIVGAPVQVGILAN